MACAVQSDEFAVGEPLPRRRFSDPVKTIGISTGACVESKSLSVEVSEQVERFDADVCAGKRSLEQAPDVFDPICMNLPVNVLFGMVDDLMLEVVGQVAVRAKRISEKLRTEFQRACELQATARCGYGWAHASFARCCGRPAHGGPEDQGRRPSQSCRCQCSSRPAYLGA